MVKGDTGLERIDQEENVPPCMIYIDGEGKWYHEGAEMIHREFIHLFYENMFLDAKGRYLIRWGGKICFVDVEDTAFVVRRVVFEAGQGGEEDRFLLFLSDDMQEALLPETLSLGPENVMYCRVKEGRFPARFNRSAYYQLAGHVEEEDGRFFIPLNGKQYPLEEKVAP